MQKEPVRQIGNPRNVVWIMVDQMRAQAMSNRGDPNVRTPNLDRLATTGIQFTRAVSGFPLCCPFRGSMLTGLYPHKAVPGHEYRLPQEQQTLAHLFNQAGYDTYYLGKWHLDGFKEREGRAVFHTVPPERRGGFKTWLGYENNNSQWDTWLHGGIGAETGWEKVPGYETDCLTDRFIAYLERRETDGQGIRAAGQPFFAVLSVQPPHDPYLAPAADMRRHNPAAVQYRPNVPDLPDIRGRAGRDLAGYYAMIENLDRNVGRIVASLEQHGLLADTHVLFFSDHGDLHGSHGQFRKTSPLEESIRIPFIVSGGQPMGYDGWRSGDIGSVLLNSPDIAPTTLGLCGLPVPEWMQGYDYSHYRCKGPAKPDEPDSAFLQSIIPTGHPDCIDKPWRGIVTRDGCKYVCFPGMPWLLHDLNRDPYEQVNLAHNEAYKPLRLQLQKQLREWLDRTGDTFDLPG